MCDRFYGGRETFLEGGTPPSVSIEISPLKHKKLSCAFNLHASPNLRVINHGKIWTKRKFYRLKTPPQPE